MLIDHIPHMPTPEELAAAPAADAIQAHDLDEAQHPEQYRAFEDLATRCAAGAIE